MRSIALTVCAVLVVIPRVSFGGHVFTVEELVKAQKAVERVYYEHRIWPKENPKPKPPFEEAVPEEVIRQKVEDNLLKARLLENYWHKTFESKDLQAEMERMAINTKDPAVLKELFSALHNDPLLIAESLARPNLVNRILPKAYGYDRRFHQDLREQVQRIAKNITPENLPYVTEGIYQPCHFKVDDESREMSFSRDIQVFSKEDFQSIIANFPLEGKVTLEEKEDAFILLGTFKKTENELIGGQRIFRKTPFETWFQQEKYTLSPQPFVLKDIASLSVPALRSVSGTFMPDSWANDPSVQGRAYHTAVWTGTEMIVWGGEIGNATRLNTGGRYNPSTDTWTATSLENAPEAREYHTAVWTGDTMIVWGGFGSSETNTGGRYNPTLDTWQPTSLINAPSGRKYHTAVWTGTEMIVFGGNWSLSYYNDGGRYNPELDQWTVMATVGAPAGRQHHSAVWTGQYMIVWGGDNFSSSFNDGGRYDPSNNSWSGVNTINAPTARSWHTAVWTGTEMIVWGGSDSTLTPLNTGGRYNPVTNTWSSVSTTGAPAGRERHTVVWTGDRMLIWGGWGCVDPPTCSTEYYLDTGGVYNPNLDLWTPINDNAGDVPLPRNGHTAVWTGSEMIIFGGFGCLDEGCLNKTYLHTGGRYNPDYNMWLTGATTDAPSTRFGHTAVWTGSEMIVWAGGGTFTWTNSGGRYFPSIDMWMPTALTGAPSPRDSHTAVWTGDKMVVWGGYGCVDQACSSSDYLNTGGLYTPSTDNWTATFTTGSPSPRVDHSAVWSGSKMIIWGGRYYNGATVYYQSGGRYDPSTNAWQTTSLTGAPSQRSNHTAVWTGSKMVVWGGNDSTTTLNTGGRYDPSTDIWKPTSTTGAPSMRTDHTAVWTGTEMIVWGGQVLDSGGRYDPLADTWRCLTKTGDTPVARYYHSAIWTGKEMIVWGGASMTDYVNSGGRYRPDLDGCSPGDTPWIATSLDRAPSKRAFHTAVWTGKAMIVFGGAPATQMGVYFTNTLPTSSPDILNTNDIITLGQGLPLQLSHTLPTTSYDDMEGTSQWTCSPDSSCPDGGWHQVVLQNCTGWNDYFSPVTSWYMGTSAGCVYETGTGTQDTFILTSSGTLSVDSTSLLYFRYFLDLDPMTNLSYASNDTPLSIPDNNPTGVTSTITIAENEVVKDVNVLVNITHTWDSDLTISLKGPDGTTVTLSANCGGFGDDYQDTLFDDEAIDSICSGAAPFSGSYKPIGSLSSFTGKTTAGNWTLTVVDGAGGDTGTLEYWALDIETEGDHAEVQIWDGSSWQTMAQDSNHWSGDPTIMPLNNDGRPWEAVEIPLSSYFPSGGTTQVRFSFTKSPGFNDGIGWFIDDVGVGDPAGDGSNPCPTTQMTDRNCTAGGMSYHDTYDQPFFQWDLSGDGIADTEGYTPDLQIPEAQLGNYGLDAPGDYPLTLTVQDRLGNVASNSVTLHVLDGISPTATVSTPNGGESWAYSPDTVNRKTHLIVWESSDDFPPLNRTKLSYSTDGGTTWTCLADSSSTDCSNQNYSGSDTLLASDQNFWWEMPTQSEASDDVQTFPSAQCRIKVEVWDQSSNTASDTSDANFYIIQPTTTAIQTVILWDSGRIESAYGTADKNALQNKLTELINHNKVNGVVLDLASVPAVQTAYGNWDAAPTNQTLANAVANAIWDYLYNSTTGQVTTTYTNARYLILVGDDKQIPFYRIPDGTSYYDESKYPAEVGLNTTTTLGSAINQGYILTDNTYGETNPETSGLASPHDKVYLNDLYAGRLVETPGQIEGVINTFLAADGQVNLTQASDEVLVTGFDFLYDSALEVKNDYVGASKTTDCLLDDPDGSGTTDPCVDKPYSPADLENQLFNTTPIHQVVNVNTHANHYNWATSTGNLSTTTMDANPTKLSRTVLYTSGCHSGLPVPSGDSNPLDFPELMAKKEVLGYLGNTGYGWGMRYGSGLTEKLMEEVTAKLLAGDAITFGKAFGEAKRSYYLEEKRYDVFDEKVLHELTYFGIPNTLVVNNIAGAVTKPSEELPPPEGPDKGCAQGICLEKTLYTDKNLMALPSGVTQLDLNFTFGVGTYQKITTNDGDYYTLNGQASGEVGDAIQPHFVYNSHLSGTAAHGILFIGGDYTTESPFDPVIAVPRSTNLDQGEGPLPVVPVWVPGVRSSFGVTSPSTRAIGELGYTNMVVHTGYYQSTNQEESKFDDIQFTLYYSNSSDTTSPAITDPGAGGFHTVNGLDATFTATVSDANGVYRVMITYNDFRTQGWKSLDLTNTSGNTWTKTLTLKGNILYYIQAVDNNGNVGILSQSGQDLDPNNQPYGSTWSGPKTWTITLTDTDGDTLPDAYEDQHTCLNKAVNDASLDPDYDYLTNADEFSYDTDPCDGDTDGGGDNDGSEYNNGRKTNDKTDDKHITIQVTKAGSDYTIDWNDTLGENNVIDGYYFVYRSDDPFFSPTEKIAGALPDSQKSHTDTTNPSCNPCYYNVWNYQLDTLPPQVDAVVPNQGPAAGGTNVSIYGENFASGAKVYFDTSLATNITVVSSNKITCTTPAHAAGAVTVKVTNPNGQEGSLATAFTYQ